jgi:hypothetical protein
MPSDPLTLEEFLQDFPDSFSGSDFLDTTESGAMQTLPWPFCFLYNNKPFSQQNIYAPSPETAAITAENLVQKLNAVAPSKGYPPLFSATPGDCP